MSLTFTLTQGNRSVPLIYDPSNQQQYRLLYGYQVGASEPIPKWHTPVDGASQLIDIADQNSTAFFTLDIAGINAPDYGDDVNKAIAKLRKWIDGENQEAARYHLVGDNNPVLLKVKREGSDITTVWNVIYGWIDDSGSHYTASATRNNFAFDVTIALTLAPYGEAESWQSLKNELQNADVLLEGSTSGLADGWSTVGGTGKTLVTSPKLIGSQSQRLAAVASAEGIQTPSVTASSTSCVAYIWIYPESEKAVDVVLRDTTAGSDVTSKTLQADDSTNISDKIYVDDEDNTWYRVSISATVTASNNIALRVLSSQSLTNFVVDGAYLEFGRTDVPHAWSSYYTILNREDITAGNPEYVNHVHYWGIGGDVPALVKYYINPDTAQRYLLYASKTSTGKLTADNLQHWADSTELDTTQLGSGTGAWSTVADASTSGGSYIRWTEGTNPTTRIGYAFASNTFFSTWNLPAFGAIPRRMLVVARSSNSATITPKIWIDTNLVFTGDDITVSNINWSLLDCGIINIGGSISPIATGSAGTIFLSTIGIGIEQSGMAATETLDIDAFVFLYSGENDDFLLIVTDVSQSIEFITDGELKKVYYSSTLDKLIPSLGSLWGLKPDVLNRVVMIGSGSVGSNYDFDITESFAITTEILPRTKHLLGVL